jgi:hypothetical protein
MQPDARRQPPLSVFLGGEIVAARRCRRVGFHWTEDADFSLVIIRSLRVCHVHRLLTARDAMRRRGLP